MSESTSMNRVMGPSRRPTFHDRLALWLLKLAKMRRRKFTEPVGEDYDKFYEAFFDEKDLELYVKDRRSSTRQETILEFLRTNAPADAKVLDVGCGLGEILGAMPPTYQLCGMDYAKSNVAISTKRLGSRATIKQGSIYEIPYESNQFDE
jgi:2-polyprenyl-3-methyl-5-hydroxy-6-metoxy-1,4-benzoquinol methylase